MTIIEKAEHPEDQQTVELTEREQAQMHLPFLLSHLTDFSGEKISSLFESEHDQQVIGNWPDEPLNDEDYNDIVDAIQEFDEEVTIFMLLDDEEAADVIDQATELV